MITINSNIVMGTAEAGGGRDKHNLGYFADLTELTTAYPTGNDGDYAILGSTDTIWTWSETNQTWVDTDTKGQVSSVNNVTGDISIVGGDWVGVSLNSSDDIEVDVKSSVIDTSLDSNSTNNKLPTSKAVVDYSVAVSNIDGATNETVDTTTHIPSTNKVTEYVTGYAVDKTDVVSTLDPNDPSYVSTKLPDCGAVATYVDNLRVLSAPVEVSVTPVSSQTATPITGALTKGARVIVVPSLSNSGAVYVKQSDTYSSINPIYPDPTNNTYEFSNISQVNVFVDNVGDSVDLVIQYFG